MKRTNFSAPFIRIISICVFASLLIILTGRNPALTAAAGGNAPIDFFETPQLRWLAAQDQTGFGFLAANRISPRAPLSELNSASATVATFTVFNLNNDGSGSLRQAILDANATNGADVINFEITGTITLLSPLPDLSRITINGPGAQFLTIKRAANASPFRIFTIPYDPNFSAVTISGLTITGGAAESGGGGGIYNANFNTTINDCVITGNRADKGGGILVHGAVFNSPAFVQVNRSAIINNVGGGFGDAVNIEGEHSHADATLNNCTISGNRSENGSAEMGGSIFVRDYGSVDAQLSLQNSTIADNDFGVFIKRQKYANADYINSIITDGVYEKLTGTNAPPPNPPMTTSRGNNVIQFPRAASAYNVQNGNTVSSDFAHVNPRLAPLRLYGGQTPTYALYYDSPAIDAGNDEHALGTDARGKPRRVDGNGDGAGIADIGAFETQQIVVTNTADSGAGSLRQAIIDNNAEGGGNLIAFNISGGGLKTINVNAADGYGLPEITSPVDINGYTQPNATANSSSTGTNANLLIELNGANAGAGSEGLRLAASGSRLRGLIINRFGVSGVTVGAGISKSAIQGNFIGTNNSGTAALSNTYGILIANNAADTLIGTNGDGFADSSERNLIGGNSGSGILAQFGASSSVIAGNLIGTDAAGSAPVPNGTGIVLFDSVTNTRIGTNGDNLADADERNIIAGNNTGGVVLDNAATNGNRIDGNYIGVKADGISILGNGSRNVALTNGASNNLIGGAVGNVIAVFNTSGISLENNSNGNTISANFIGIGADGATSISNGAANNHGIGVSQSSNNIIGGAESGAGNRIANAGTGVAITGADSVGNKILSNRIFNNSRLAIDLGGDGVTANDAVPDADTGANRLQNFPVITSAVGNQTTFIYGTVPGVYNRIYTVQVYVNSSCDSSGNGEGMTLLETVTAAASGNGIGNFGFGVSTAQAPVGSFITATATDNETGDTSEFSACREVTAQAAVQFSAASYFVSENGTATITVTRSNPSVAESSIGYQTTAGGTATGGANCTGAADYVNASGTLRWAAGDNSPKTFEVAICPDALGDPDETINIALNNPTSNVYPGTPNTAAITIDDDDQTQIVTNTNDGGSGSLRQAILNANASTYESTVINFASPLFDSPQIITLSGQSGFRELRITKSVTINGKGANLLTVQRAANETTNFRIFHVVSGAVVLKGMTITGGKLDSSPTGVPYGSAITSSDQNNVVTLDGCHITNNATLYNSAVTGFGTMNIRNSTISGNTSEDWGGGISYIAYPGATLTVVNSTISGNTNTGMGISGLGAGIFSNNGGDIVIRNSTITDNGGEDVVGGGIYVSSQSTVRIGNSIIAGNRNRAGEPDVAVSQLAQGSLISEGYNFIGSASGTTAFNQTGDVVGTVNALLNPLLAPLGHYGGATPTHALYTNSTAVNKANPANQPPTDQRGLPRVINSRADIGAFEVNFRFHSSPLGSGPGRLPGGQRGQAYNVQIIGTRLDNFAEHPEPAADWGLVGMSYAYIGGTLPAGLMFDSDTGVLSGTPTVGGTFNLAFKAIDWDGMAGAHIFTLNISAPTSATVFIGGQVLTPGGSGLRNALVTFTDSAGNSRTILTGVRGTFNFTEARAGETYVISVNSKRYTFQPQVITAVTEITDLNFVGVSSQ